MNPFLPAGHHYRIGAHAVLADGRTAALVTPDGDVAWLCWPRVDSDPVLLRILDEERGGHFALRPTAPDATIGQRGYLGPTLGTRSTWRVPGVGVLTVDEALAVDGPPRLLRILRAVGGEIEVEAHFQPAFGAATLAASWDRAGGRAVASAGGLRLSVDAPATWTVDGDGAHALLRVRPGPPSAVVLSAVDEPLSAREALRLFDATLTHWGSIAARMRLDRVVDSVVCRILELEDATEAVVRSGLVICGLRQRSAGYGIVAAPTTSLPQMHQSPLTWDYRYAWPRDTALAAIALLRLGLVEEAAALGDFCGEACRGGVAPALLRVDGTAPPPEITLDHLAGHGGSRPVRVGNGAAAQAQLDVAGEVLDLAHNLHRAGALPESLQRAAPELARLLVGRWREPDHGIWEVRGRPHHYNSSLLMAWTGLRRAAGLARQGAIAGDATAWEAAAEDVRAAILATVGVRGGVPLSADNSGLDAALALVPLVGFLRPRDPLTVATLRSIGSGLGHTGLVERHTTVDVKAVIQPHAAPFIFAGFWLASALEHSGRSGGKYARAALRERGYGGLLGEVALPRYGPLGNYPQVQSHAALILTALPRPRRRRRR